ncbi:MAG: hypothetical protein AAF628_17500 [Planctomycetota bacterium]
MFHALTRESQFTWVLRLIVAALVTFSAVAKISSGYRPEMHISEVVFWGATAIELSIVSFLWVGKAAWGYALLIPFCVAGSLYAVIARPAACGCMGVLAFPDWRYEAGVASVVGLTAAFALVVLSGRPNPSAQGA